MSWKEAREGKSADGETGADYGKILVERGEQRDFDTVCDLVSVDSLAR